MSGHKTACRCCASNYNVGTIPFDTIDGIGWDKIDSAEAKADSGVEAFRRKLGTEPSKV